MYNLCRLCSCAGTIRIKASAFKSSAYKGRIPFWTVNIVKRCIYVFNFCFCCIYKHFRNLFSCNTFIRYKKSVSYWALSLNPSSASASKRYSSWQPNVVVLLYVFLPFKYLNVFTSSPFRQTLRYPNSLKTLKNQPFLRCQSWHTSVCLRLYALKSQDFSVVIEFEEFF